MKIRALRSEDALAALSLYKELTGETPVAPQDHFAHVIEHPGTIVLGADVDGEIRALLTLHILPNMTYGGRPYTLIENVVTAKAFQGRGLGRAVMEHAIELAWKADAYKIMLLTGQDTGARGFYEKLGFTTDQKYGMTLRRVPTRKPA